MDPQSDNPPYKSTSCVAQPVKVEIGSPSILKKSKSSENESSLLRVRNISDLHPPERTESPIHRKSSAHVFGKQTNEFRFWSFSCPKCPHKVRFVDYDPQVSKRLAAHYFKYHRDDHLVSNTLIRGRHCLLCTWSFKSTKLTVVHFWLRHADVLHKIFFAALPEQNLSKHLNMDRKVTRINSTVYLYSKYLDFSKTLRNYPDKMDPEIINTFLKAIKGDNDRVFRLLHLISDCHIPLPDGSRLLKSPIFLGITRSSEMISDSNVPRVNGRQENRLSQSVKMCSTLDPCHEERIPDDGSTEWANLDRPLTCHKCGLDFPDLAGLVAHVTVSNHEGAVLGCKFCEEFFLRVIGKPLALPLEAHLTVHLFSSEHLHNRYLRLFSQERQQARSKIVKGPLCEMCATEIDYTGTHLKSQDHEQRRTILLSWVEFCDLRRICPVTCERNELELFVKLTFPKTKSNNQRKLDFYILQVLTVFSNLHESKNGVLMEQLSRKIYSNEFGPRLPNFICFSCSFFEYNRRAFLDHLFSEDHKFKCSETIKPSFLKCEPCNSLMVSTTAMRLHLYTSRHLDCSWHYNNTPFSLTPSEPQQPSNFCSLCCKEVSENDDEHMSSENHRTRIECAEKYLLYCNQHRLQPAEIGIKAINDFIEEIYRIIPRCRLSEADVVLEVVNALHKPINGSKINTIKKILSFYETCRAASVSQRQVIFKENSYDILNEEQTIRVTMCPKCYKICSSATELVFHAFSAHGISSDNFLRMEEFSPTDEVFQCSTCKRNLKSPMSHALHFDMHHLEKEMSCKTCSKKYASPADFYAKDVCSVNSPKRRTDRELIIEGIDLYIGRSASKQKKILQNSDQTNEIRLLAPASYQPEINRKRVSDTRVLKLWCSISKLGGNKLHPQPIVEHHDPEISNENVFSGTKRKKPDNLSFGDSDGLETKRNCFSSPPQSPTALFERYNFKKAGFCIDCENCQVNGCDHEGHLRRKVFSDIMKHSDSHGHKNIKVLSDCPLSNCEVVANDLLYSKECHDKIQLELRRTRRKNTISTPFNCKFHDCKFKARKLDDLLPHIKSHFE